MGPAIFAHYPVNRRLTAAEEATISEMLTVKPNTKRVKELVEKQFGKCVTLKDISNLKTKQTRKGLEEPQLLLSTLQNITTTQDAQAGIVVNENNILEICYLQTNHMTKLFDRFQEFIDGTYNVNGHGMPLYCLVMLYNRNRSL